MLSLFAAAAHVQWSFVTLDETGYGCPTEQTRACVSERSATIDRCRWGRPTLVLETRYLDGEPVGRGPPIAEQSVRLSTGRLQFPSRSRGKAFLPETKLATLPAYSPQLLRRGAVADRQEILR